jgi:hypothetical protein
MNEQAILWFLGQLIVIIGSGVIAYINVILKLNDHSTMASNRHYTLDARVVKLETLLTMFGKKAANILHSPHTPELDTLLEKYVKRHYELTYEEWKRLKQLCEEVIKEPHIKGDKVVFAAFLAAVADHKLDGSKYYVDEQNKL